MWQEKGKEEGGVGELEFREPLFFPPFFFPSLRISLGQDPI